MFSEYAGENFGPEPEYTGSSEPSSFIIVLGIIVIIGLTLFFKMIWDND